MIRTALDFIKKELDTYFVDRQQDPANYSSNNVVDLQSLVAPDGTINLNDERHITIMLVGIEEELREGKRPHYLPTADKKYLKMNPPVEINLRVLFIAHHTNYETALRDLSEVVSFFQTNLVFDEGKYPSLNESVTDPLNKPWQLIERLSFKMESLSFEQQNNLWAMLGGKYIPSVLYKASLFTVFDTKSNDAAPAITEMSFIE